MSWVSLYRAWLSDLGSAMRKRNDTDRDGSGHFWGSFRLREMEVVLVLVHGLRPVRVWGFGFQLYWFCFDSMLEGPGCIV